LLEKMQRLARSRGGECLSKEYKNSQTKLHWRCKLGHEWEAVSNSITPRDGFKGSWCPFCAGRLPKQMALEQLRELATERSGELLSKRYGNARSHLRWRCAKGHEWKATSDSVKRVSWCPVCSGTFLLTLAKMRDYARGFGGKCISKKYVNSKSHIRWRCAEGHEWESKPDHVRQGNWCPICSSGISERICRALIERLTGILFPKARPKWLKNVRGNQMELDGFAPSLNLAFEYQGQQHFKHVPVFHSHSSEFRKRQQDDERKRKLCFEHGVRLLEIPFHIPHTRLQSYLSDVLQKLKVDVVNAKHIEISQLGVWRSAELAKMRSIAISSGGKLLSKFYINESTGLRWLCSDGHQWEAKPHDIKQGHWCPRCGKKKASEKLRTRTFDELQKIVKSRGGDCLSKHYLKARDKLKLRCALGHEWETVPMQIISGHWCPKCARRFVGKKSRLTLEEIQATAAKRGGECLTKTYFNAHQILTWRCAAGHKWETNANCVRRGTWCPVCARKRSKGANHF
jgi:hypothetical protein